NPQALRFTLNTLGMTLNEMGEWSAAEANLREYIERFKDPDTASVCIALCMACLGQKKLAEARQALVQGHAILESSPNDRLSKEMVLGDALIATAEGRRTEADQQFARTVEAVTLTEYRWQRAWVIWKWGEAIRSLDGEDDPHARDLLTQAAAE